MRISYNWLKEYVDLSVSAPQLGELYTSAGLELEEIEQRGTMLAGVVLARVTQCEPVAGSDHLHLCRVDAGPKGQLNIVCGAPNVAAGRLVACATVGTVLPGGFAIAAKQTFGVQSEGMLCSLKELGLSEDHGGIWLLDELFTESTPPLGTELVDLLPLQDQVLVIGLTPNRSDCLGMLNCAREAAALTGAALTLPAVEYPEAGPAVCEEVAVEVRDFDLCPRYVVRVVKNVKLGPSPLWMQNYLLAAGMRPINNVVDISNFVMLEMNQPLHTFDYQTIQDHTIVVRASEPGETMQTLDGKTHTFLGEEILICDGKDGARAICIGGIMGGMDTEVTANTTDILIEAACFQPVATRRAARRLGIPSEASARFEKGVDVAQADAAARRAAQLLVQYGGGVADQGAIDVRAPQFANGFPEKEIYLRPARVNQILGTAFTDAEIVDVMQRLSFEITQQGDALRVKVPSYRRDITLEVDLIEEVARLKGFACIPQTMPLNATRGGRNEQQKLLQQIKNLCVAAGLCETIQYSFISPKDSDKLQLPANHPWRRGLTIANPLSEEQSVMRQTLLPGLLQTAARNQARRNLDLRFFEMGKVFLTEQAADVVTQPKEVMTLGFLMAGASAAGWQQSAQDYDFYHLKGVVERVCQGLGVATPSFQVEQRPYLHPGRTAALYLNQQQIGYLGELHPAVAEAYELSGRVYVAELALPTLLAAAAARGNCDHGLPRYPASVRDIAVIGDSQVPAAQIEAQIFAAGGSILSTVQLFDLYDQAPIPAGQRSLAYSLQFRAEDRTLTDEEVNEAFQSIVTALQQNCGYQLR